jgi:hypothetical protein
VEPCDVKWLESLRRHRHDVLNGLQLVKAYLQLGKSDQALGALDRLAEWLQSIARIQAKGHVPELVRAAMECPHVRVQSLPEPDGLAPSQVAELCQLLTLSEQFAVQYNQSMLAIRVQSGVRAASPLRAHVYIREDLFDSWHNEHREYSPQGLEIYLEPAVSLQ